MYFLPCLNKDDDDDDDDDDEGFWEAGAHPHPIFLGVPPPPGY